MSNQLHSSQFRCFFGLLHVKTACIIIGAWHLILNLFALTLLGIIAKNPTIVHHSGDNKFEDDSIDTLPTPVSRNLPESDYYSHRDHSLNHQDIDMGGLVCLCMIAITLMLIYGAMKNRPSHLLPFFFLQLCDFAITTLSAAGYLCYLRTIHKIIENSKHLPWKEELMRVDSQTLAVLVLFAFVFMVMLKAYCIGIVWRCYKYLTIRQNATILSYIIQDQPMNTENLYNSLLPGYEEALNMKAPPSYAIAMQNNQTGTNVPNPDNMSPPSYTQAMTIQEPPANNCSDTRQQRNGESSST